MAVKTYSLKRDGNVQLSEHFRLKEFQCHDWSDKILHDDKLCPVLEKLFFIKIPGKKIRAVNVNSGYRTPAWSCRPDVGGYATDPHTRGIAADIKIPLVGGGYVPANLICEYLEDIGFIGGVGKINDYSVHIDVRDKKCWFDETHGSRIVNSWYDYFGEKKPAKDISSMDSKAFIFASRTTPAKGIDVSKHNGNIDWDKMKGKVDFAIIRIGYGSDYSNQDDAQYKHNIAGCEKIGIPYGVYLYSYADTVEKAASEADHAIRLLKGYRPTLPLYYDLEENKVARLGKAKLLEIAKTFCKKVEAAGYTFGVYANTNWWNNYLTDGWYNGYSRWVAQYNSVCTYKGDYDLWQYTSKGKIEGFSGVFDMNHCYKCFGCQPGDVNGDGKVNSSDARIALRAAAKLEGLTDAQKKAGDTDGDGDVDSADARNILRKAGKLE